jgi:cyclic pyranopterin phosphate synthase
MTDRFGRTIDYLRVSVTDLCNLRCLYCMPAQGVKKLRRGDILSLEEIEEIVRAAVRCGIRKVRITGGEPLVRPGIVGLCRCLAGIPGLGELCMTTNGTLLPRFAHELRTSGVTRLNVSLDTLDPEKYRRITRLGNLDQALDGLRAAQEAGFARLKLNCVLLGGVNDGEIADFVALTKGRDIEVRFIELMPMGECAGWDEGRFLSNSAVLEAVPALESIGTSGVAKLYRVKGWRGTVGLISPVTDHFCPACNRLRLTADGKLKPCLHSVLEIPVRGLHGEALEQAICTAVREKPLRHHLDAGSDSARGMNAIGG